MKENEIFIYHLVSMLNFTGFYSKFKIYLNINAYVLLNNFKISFFSFI